MEKKLSENLFLLEFLVDKVTLDPSAVPWEIADVAGETCVSFKFFDNDPLDICEADFTPSRDYSRESCNMKSGKSCLFSISEEQAQRARRCFDVDVAIFKKLSNGILPDKLQIGTATVPIADMFDQIIQALLKKDPTYNPSGDCLGRTLKDSFAIYGPSRDDIGCITVFVRMSCFGKVIVTQFQMNLEEKSVFFKDREGKSLYKYRKAYKEDKNDSKYSSGSPRPSNNYPGPPDSCINDTCPHMQCPPEPCPNSMNPQNHLRPADPDMWNAEPAYGTHNSPYTAPEFGQYGNCFDRSNGETSPFEQSGNYMSNMCDPFCAESNLRPGISPPNLFPSQGFPCTPISNPESFPKSCYQEIGAEMAGNALTIRVHKDRNMTVKRIDKDGQESEAGCTCLNHGAVPQASSPTWAPCSEKQILSMKPGDDPTNPFTFKMSGCPNMARQNITVVPPTNTRTDGMQVTEISDPNKDVFILRIGKKSEGVDKKANLELELVTPKGLEKKPIPKKESRDTQYLDSDLATKLPKKGKKGKGKGKKGKGKNKKGKKKK